ncbi:hypothetical protein [uncultured Sulfitobacter sp.]|uniref:hypothetical protein n=1 Tax=Sulfitobacter sp. SH22 TaxID=3421172 RepID=UPI0025EBA950|nr:hypothetical protein [uncultured Sulfitobacter sp.]
MTNTPTETTTPTEMNSWAMACSLLVGVRQALAKGQAEHAAIIAANPNRTFIAEARVVADTVNVLRDVENTLDWELSRTARSSNLAMPEQS